MTATHVTVDSRASGREMAEDDETAPPAPLPSFRAIYDEYFDFVWSSARRLGVSLEAMDDVVQEVFIVVHARLGTLEQPASLRSWLYSVVRRTVSTHHRARHNRSARETPEPAIDESAIAFQPSPFDLAVLGDDVKLLWRLLGELDAARREVLVLAELEEMTMPEIAEAIGVPLNTAYSRLRLARQGFNEALARYTAQRKTRG